MRKRKDIRALKKRLIVTTLSLLLLLLAGCQSDSGAQAEATPSPTAMPTATPTVMASAVPTTPPEPTPTPQGYVADGFRFYALTDELKQRITGMSYPEQGSDIIGYDDLNYIELLYYDFDGQVKEGELIVNVRVAQEVTEIFYELYKAQYPFESVVLVDDFGEPGNDSLSMAANNTSGFNYRTVVGSEKLSRHSYGAAIDVSPVLNPYIDGDRIAPENGKPYIDRTQDVPGIIDHDDLCYQLFIAHGWVWGGDWPDSKDYQHFSKDLGYDT